MRKMEVGRREEGVNKKMAERQKDEAANNTVNAVFQHGC